MPSLRHSGMGARSDCAGCDRPARSVVEAAAGRDVERGELVFHIGQPRGVACHQQRVVLAGQVTGLTLAIGV